MKTRIFPYKQGSKSAKALARGLGGKVLKREGSRFRPRFNDFMVNWGSTNYPPEFEYAGFLNPPHLVAQASNKRKFFETLEPTNVPIPDWTTDHDKAQEWSNEGYSVCTRTLLSASGGRGLTVNAPHSDIVPGPLYTLYMKKKHEFRVHVVRNGFSSYLHIQQKKKRYEMEADFQIRNHENGWVFGIQDVACPPLVEDVADHTIWCLNLDFGAVDIIWNEYYQQATVLEVNTAPGLEGTTLDKYVEFLSYVRGEE